MKVKYGKFCINQPKAEFILTEFDAFFNVSTISYKGGFFSESAMYFSNLQKKIFQKTILNLKFKF